jgi:hypothetical protein
VSHFGYEIDRKGDTLPILYANRTYCFSERIDLSKEWRTIRNFRRVYPLALIAKEKMRGLEEELLKLPTRKEQRAFTKEVERQIKDEYTPVLKKMSISQGKMLIRLIDRETELTSYSIVKEFRGGFVAGFWQGIARIFGHNLKDEYEKDGRDKLLEQLIILYEAGILPEY